MKLPASVEDLIHALSELPSIGPRQATRLVFHLLREGRPALDALAKDFAEMKLIKTCARCFFIHENDGEVCDLCGDPHRNQGVIMVVEKETDLISLESTGRYQGRYFITGQIGRTGTLEDWQKQRIAKLKEDIGQGPGGKAKEIILGFNPTSVGDFHATLLSRELAPLSEKISRLGRGLPTGGEIEFADDETLGSALERRS